MLLQQYIPGEGDSNKIIFPVPVWISKKSEINDFNPYAPKIKYVQYEILLVSLHMLCMVRDKMLQNGEFYRD